MQHTYPGTAVDVAEIDPAVTKANHHGPGLAQGHPDQDHLGRRPPVRRARTRTRKQYDLIFGDAFNDFSVPWHLTTREFNEKIAKMLGPDGVYMINIIDVYESDAKAEERGRGQDQEGEDHRSQGRRHRVRREALAQATGLRRLPRRLGQDRQAHLPPRLHLRDRRQPRLGAPRDLRRRRLEGAAGPTSTTSAAATTTPSSSRTTGCSSPGRSARSTRRPSTSARAASS